MVSVRVSVVLTFDSGPVFVEFPLDSLYCRSTIEEQYEREKPKGPGLFNTVARWYIGRHVTNLFKNSSRIRLHKPLPVPVQVAARWQVRKRHACVLLVSV